MLLHQTVLALYEDWMLLVIEKAKRIEHIASFCRLDVLAGPEQRTWHQYESNPLIIAPPVLLLYLKIPCSTGSEKTTATHVLRNCLEHFSFAGPLPAIDAHLDQPSAFQLRLDRKITHCHVNCHNLYQSITIYHDINEFERNTTNVSGWSAAGLR